ncbi:hypothetical protein [Listeria booriae]|uniref:Uncharacterized protein n=2 Tax=Listeria booriae TaxID=1552123 RepID=A0A7X0WGN3_9LIST|nr:hypothetical protein [Listeria booriae]MBC1333469.1 hypothetical protein [Listeria booriae]MBC2373635.1 hypothetical protein [Listeria booriae]MBC2388774.1 hypothetical protein [Listeria booriae]
MSYEKYIEVVDLAEKHLNTWFFWMGILTVIMVILILVIAFSSKMPFSQVTLPVLFVTVLMFMVPLFLQYFNYVSAKNEASNTLAASQSREWQVKEKGDLASLGNASDTVMSGVFFLGIGKVSSKQESYYAFAKKTDQGIQVKRTDEAFKTIRFSDIYIQEKAAESPHYALEVYRYKDKRVEKVIGSSPDDEKSRLIFVVPEKTVQQDFHVDATK